jgi:integrase/recombinase XerD
MDRKVVHALTDDQLKRLIQACRGKQLKDRRDEAIVRLMVETGMRAGEVIGLQTTDVDLQRGLVTVRRGEGAKRRVAPFGPQTATATDRYILLAAPTGSPTPVRCGSGVVAKRSGITG